jgi:hypothetical protein
MLLRTASVSLAVRKTMIMTAVHLFPRHPERSEA